jgi:hypothetical protein
MYNNIIEDIDVKKKRAKLDEWLKALIATSLTTLLTTIFNNY